MATTDIRGFPAADAGSNAGDVVEGSASVDPRGAAVSDYEPTEFDPPPDAAYEWLVIEGGIEDFGDGELIGKGVFLVPGPPNARETHMPWFCSECAAFRCSAWTPEGGGRCCWCGVWLAMP